MNSLSDELLMDRTTLTRSLEVLFKDKLIKNIKTNDARKRIVKLTDKVVSTAEEQFLFGKKRLKKKF